VYVLELESESVVAVLILIIFSNRHNLYPHTLLCFLILKDQLTSALLEVFSFLSDMFLVAELNGFIVNSDSSITTVLSNNLNFAVFFGW